MVFDEDRIIVDDAVFSSYEALVFMLYTERGVAFVPSRLKRRARLKGRAPARLVAVDNQAARRASR